MSRIGGVIRDTMSIGNDAPRVSVRERGRPSFQLLLNARDPTPGHSYLRFLRRKCLLPSAPRVRLRTLNRTSYESRNAMTNEPTAARAASALRNFSIWGPPIESSAARAQNASQSHFTAVARTTPGKRDFDKHLFDIHTLDPSGNGAWLRCPKNGANSSAESAPKREWQSKNVNGREKCPQVSWPSHPTCQGDG